MCVSRLIATDESDRNSLKRIPVAFSEMDVYLMLMEIYNDDIPDGVIDIFNNKLYEKRGVTEGPDPVVAREFKIELEKLRNHV